MSFDLSSNSPSLTQAIVSFTPTKPASSSSLAAGNEKNQRCRLSAAALNNYVVGIASTTNYDTRSSFSNFGSMMDVLIAAPGENIDQHLPRWNLLQFFRHLVSARRSSASTAAADATSARPSLNQSQAASALSHAIKLTPDLNHGRLDVYQAVSAWVNSSGSSGSGSGSGSGNCLLFCN